MTDSIKNEQLPAVLEIYAEKFPIIKEFPPNLDYRFIKIKPNRIWMLSYQKGFGHRDYLEL